MRALQSVRYNRDLSNLQGDFLHRGACVLNIQSTNIRSINAQLTQAQALARFVSKDTSQRSTVGLITPSNLKNIRRDQIITRCTAPQAVKKHRRFTVDPWEGALVQAECLIPKYRDMSNLQRGFFRKIACVFSIDSISHSVAIARVASRCASFWLHQIWLVDMRCALSASTLSKF